MGRKRDAKRFGYNGEPPGEIALYPASVQMRSRFK